MTTVRVPTPLRPFTGGAKEVDVTGATVGAALHDLALRHPDLQRHLFDEAGALRPYVNVFVNDNDVRSLQGDATALQASDRVMIIPSIAGGKHVAVSPLARLDHAALRLNQVSIILLLVMAFVLDLPWLVAVVATLMLFGTAVGRPGFIWLYRLLRRASFIKPDIVQDHPEPHRFAHGLGGVFLVLSISALALRAPTLGWGLACLVVTLAALNLFAGFCVGCALYYWLHRLGVPGFRVGPPPSTFPGRRPNSMR